MIQSTFQNGKCAKKHETLSNSVMKPQYCAGCFGFDKLGLFIYTVCTLYYLLIWTDCYLCHSIIGYILFLCYVFAICHQYKALKLLHVEKAIHFSK